TFSPGLHHVQIDRKGFQPRELSIQLGAGEHRTLDVELRPQAKRIVKTVARAQAGTVTARTVPWSRVFDGARLLGTTPLANVPLSEGSHILTFVNPDFPPLRQSIVVRAGEETKISLELKH